MIKREKLTPELLLYWFHNYGISIYTLDELLKLKEYISIYGVSTILDIIISSSVFGDFSSNIILNAIRTDTFEELVTSLPDVSKFDSEALSIYNNLEQFILEFLIDENC